MTVWYKQGVMGDLQPVAQKGLGRVAKRLWNNFTSNLFITSIREANHSPGSLHYVGLAFDINKDLFRYENQTLIANTRDALGPDWDVIDEGDHIHCEYDPK